ncbi:MAG: alginate lyase family protein [Bacillota bacterium]
MTILKMIKSKKDLREKLRILSYRLRKKRYIKKTMKKGISSDHSNEEVSKRLFYFTKESVQNLNTERKRKIISEANRILKNEYRDISGGTIKIKDSVEWNKDYIFEYYWVNQHYSKYNLKDKNIKTDVKHVWELSRFYHLLILSKAYVISGDELFVDKILMDINNWSKQNPVNESVNWTVSMEVAIRVVNLIQVISLIKDSNRFNTNIKKNLNNLVHMHGTYIWNNLEKGITTNNHYLSNLVGLIWVAIYFKDSTSSYFKNIAEKYLAFSLDQLTYELGYQINEDGFSYEDSVSYHGLNTEMLLLTINILEKNEITYPDNHFSYVKKMVKALQVLLINKKNIPLIGDQDNGRLLICDIDSFLDKTNFGYLIDVALEMDILHSDTVDLSLISLDNSGIYRLSNRFYDIIVKCGKIGLDGLGGHAHNDQLSFILNILGEQVIVDPGTGYYSGDYKLRRLLRSTDSHNTFVIKNYEQNNIDIDLFKMIEMTNSEVVSLTSDYFEGKHFGYFHSHGIEYKRSIRINGDTLIIRDSISNEINEEKHINFIFDCDVKLEKINDYTLNIRKNKKQIELTVIGGSIDIEEQYVSKSYGETIITNKVKVMLKREKIESIFKFIREVEV